MSQITAISLAANYGIMGIIIGGCGGFMCCIVMAIALGTLIERFCNERFLFLFSGCLFLSFAALEVSRVIGL
jgi:putative Ca2+/H+ antiporter (TMEM165/GDT1 family)